jgi:hypothetical protein
VIADEEMTAGRQTVRVFSFHGNFYVQENPQQDSEALHDAAKNSPARQSQDRDRKRNYRRTD